jgi:hypothetical protein
MSEADIDRLVAERSLERHAFRDEDVVSLWSKAAASYADASVPGLSTDGAFRSIYNAALQAAIATLAAHGLRVKSTANHYRTFYAIQKLTDALEPHGLDFQEMRAVRNDSVYEATHNPAEVAESLTEAQASMPSSLALHFETPSSASGPGLSPGSHTSDKLHTKRSGPSASSRTAPSLFRTLYPVPSYRVTARTEGCRK